MMLVLLTLAMLAAVMAAGIAFLGVIVKLVLLPVRLAFGLTKVAILGVGTLILLLVGLPFVAVLLFPLVVLGALGWGAMRLARI
jgi:hypothetical protein